MLSSTSPFAAAATPRAALNVAPTFIIDVFSLDLPQNTGNVGVAGLFHVSDTDSGQTLTWSTASAPQHGTLSFTSPIHASGGSDIAPTGTITYRATAGFAGLDSFTVQVSDGTALTTRTIDVAITPAMPGTPSLAAASDHGASSTDRLTNANLLTFSGTSATGDTSSTVRVFLDTNGDAVYTAGIDPTATATLANGRWTVDDIDVSGVGSGTYNTYAIVTSATGDLSSARSAGLAVTLDHVATQVASVSVPADGSYTPGQDLTFTVHTTEAVVVDTGGGTPSLNILLDSGGTVAAYYVGGSGSADLTFSYTVASGNADHDGIVIQGLALNGASVRDAAGNDADLQLHGVAATSNVLVSPGPEVTAIARVGAALTHATSVDYSVTFSDAVTGVDAGDFSLAGTGVGGAVTAVRGSGASYVVTVERIVGDGTLRLDLHDSGTGIVDGAGNPLAAGYTGGQAYTVDHTAPLLAGPIAISDTTLKIGATATVTFTFAEAVSGFAIEDVTVSNATLSNLSASANGMVWTATLTPAAGTSSATNVLTLDLGGLADLAGNAGIGSVDSASYAVDTTVPVPPAPSRDLFLVGGSGNDTLSGGAGADVLLGGPSGAGHWQFHVDADGTLTALHGDVPTTLNPAGAGLSFLDADGSTLAALSLLYHAAFGRAPDLAGITFWAQAGVDIGSVASQFLAAPEWQAAGTAALSDTAFIDAVYHAAFGRAADAGGLAFWRAQLDAGTGTAALTRPEVLLAVATSAEHAQAWGTPAGYLIGESTQGIENDWIAGNGDDRLMGGAGSDVLVGGAGVDTAAYSGRTADYKIIIDSAGQLKVEDKANGDVDQLFGIEQAVFSDGTLDLGFLQGDLAALKETGLLYQAVLDRAGDAGGLQWWVGRQLDDVPLAQAFVETAEFRARYDSLSDIAFVEALYANSGLNANAASGQASWELYLATHTRAELVASWVSSDAVVAAQFAGQGLWMV
jgi:VCBS repeat-containing protein